MKINKNSWQVKFLFWRARYLTNRQFILILCALIGFLSGILAVLMKKFTLLIQSLLQNGLVMHYHRAFYFVFPTIGFFIVYLIIKYVIRHRVESGIPYTLYAISKLKGLMPTYQMYASLLTAPITVGFGGSVGLEGPMVASGSSISSNLGKLFHVNQSERMLLIACACAGTMAAMFKAPVAAIVFAIEVFSLDLTLMSLIPLISSSLLAVLTSYFFFGNEFLLPFYTHEDYKFADTPYYIGLGILSGIVSIYFSIAYERIIQFYESIDSLLKRLFFGGLMIGIIVFFIPPLYGEGFELMNNLIKGQPELSLNNNVFGWDLSNEWQIIALMGGLVLFKVIATATTVGAGGVGGVFAPALFMGSMMGHFFGRLVNKMAFWGQTVPLSSFTLVGMAGLMAGVLHAPLTAIFLIAELTGGHTLFVPLMMTAAISFSISKYYLKHSFYSKSLALKGELITHNKDQAILTLMDIESVIEKNFIQLTPQMNLGEVVYQGIVKSNRNIFPVVHPETQHLEGVISIDDIRSIMFEHALYNEVTVAEMMKKSVEVIHLQTDKMSDIMRKFQDTGAWNLPVVREGVYIGFISKSRLLSAYRRKLIYFSNS
ncbi:chloride channel protein [Capnocytophaga canimorsus]|uniref:chloride channel protein n=1 Tax=Capnocytophaga canimorsus TaxID=28188 RepID=UPI0037D944FE